MKLLYANSEWICRNKWFEPLNFVLVTRIEKVWRRSKCLLKWETASWGRRGSCETPYLSGMATAAPLAVESSAADTGQSSIPWVGRIGLWNHTASFSSITHSSTLRVDQEGCRIVFGGRTVLKGRCQSERPGALGDKSTAVSLGWMKELHTHIIYFSSTPFLLNGCNLARHRIQTTMPSPKSKLMRSKDKYDPF